jgi:hypothetical protein
MSGICSRECARSCLTGMDIRMSNEIRFDVKQRKAERIMWDIGTIEVMNIVAEIGGCRGCRMSLDPSVRKQIGLRILTFFEHDERMLCSGRAFMSKFNEDMRRPLNIE